MKTSHPLVSIGIPVFNGEKTLRTAIDSALEQTYPNLEIVLSDNCSTDGTADIIREYEDRDPRVRHVRFPETVNVMDNFDRALVESEGKYFTWLADDDRIAPEFVSSAVDLLEREDDVVLCTSSFKVLDYEGKDTSMTISLDPIFPEKTWKEILPVFFQWPQTVAGYGIYGVGSREVLRRWMVGCRHYRGHPLAMDCEARLLSMMALEGRIVATPEVLRSSLWRDNSTGSREIGVLSGFDLAVLGIDMRLRLFWNAFTSSLPWEMKKPLLGVTLRNFRNHLFLHPYYFGYRITQQRAELAILRAAASERIELYRSLTVHYREMTNKEDDGDVENPVPVDWEELPPEPGSSVGPTDTVATRFRSFIQYFRRPIPADATRCLVLQEEVGNWRRYCEELLELNKRLEERIQGLGAE